MFYFVAIFKEVLFAQCLILRPDFRHSYPDVHTFDSHAFIHLCDSPTSKLSPNSRLESRAASKSDIRVEVLLRIQNRSCKNGMQ